MDGAHVGVLEQADEVSLGGFLEGEDGGRLEASLSSDLVRNLLNQSLEGELADEEVSGLLVLADLASGDGAGAEAVGLLDASGGRGLLGGLGVEDLSGLLDAGRALSCGGLGSCHLVYLQPPSFF